MPPAGSGAVRAWLLLFTDHLATKKVIAAALQSLVGGSRVFEENMSKMQASIKAIYDRAVESGDIRPDVNPVDHLRAILGVAFFGDSEDWKESATRLVDILILEA